MRAVRIRSMAGGSRRGLPFVLQELVAQGLCPVRQPAVLGPQGLHKGVEGSRSWRSSALIWSKAPYLSRARRSSSCHQQTGISKHRATRNKRGNDEIE
jgi:hypothetical protein